MRIGRAFMTTVRPITPLFAANSRSKKSQESTMQSRSSSLKSRPLAACAPVIFQKSLPI
jgi:hypothetical protein